MLSETQKGYLAGILDGEGSLILTKSKHGIMTQIRVTSTTVELLNYLQTILGGNIYSFHHKDRPKWNNYGIWVLATKPVIRQLLREIAPHMIIKKDHADAILTWFDIRLIRQRKGQPIPERELDLVKRVKDLNHRPVRV